MTRRSEPLRTDRARHRHLVWALSLALLAQMLLPIQAHTAWQTAPDGRVVMICTLQGYQPLRLDPEHKDSSTRSHSPAVHFSLLLGEAAPKPAISVAPPWLLARLAPTDGRAVSLTEARALRRSIRAPPAI